MTQTMVVINIDNLGHLLLEKLSYIRVTRNLEQYEIEDLFDWIITEGMHEVLSWRVRGHSKILQHRDNDIFRIAYDEVRALVTSHINAIFYNHRLFFMQGETVKLLVTYHQVYIVRSQPPAKPQ